MLWYEKTSDSGKLTAAFNRNSFATYAGLALVVTTGLLLASFEEGRTERGLRARPQTALLERGQLLILPG